MHRLYAYMSLGRAAHGWRARNCHYNADDILLRSPCRWFLVSCWSDCAAYGGLHSLTVYVERESSMAALWQFGNYCLGVSVLNA